MSEMKRGYPNPNFTDEDVDQEPDFGDTGRPGLERNVTISQTDLASLMNKAIRFDILKRSFESGGHVDDDVLKCVMGATENEYKEKYDNYSSKYWNERDKNQKLESQVKELQEKLAQMEVKPSDE